MNQHASDAIRIGSRVGHDSEPLTNIRKMLIFKGAAYNLASNEIPNILESKLSLLSNRCKLSESNRCL